MNGDNVLIAWGLLLVAFGLLGTMISFMYFADKKSKRH